MKKIVLLAFVLMLWSTVVVAKSISPVISYPAETELLVEADLPVHNIDSGKNFSTIQEAINHNETIDGHTIFVEKGTYYEQIVLNKSISLIGENRNTAIIDGGGTGSVVTVARNSVNITGFTVQGSGSNIIDAGVKMGNVGNVTHCKISENNIRNNEVGIYLGLFRSSNNSLSGNNITENREGIVFKFFRNSSDYNVVSGNNITENSNYGIRVYASECNAILGNNIRNNGAGIFLWSSNNTVSGNNITNNEWGIRLNSSSNNTVSGNNITNNEYQGIWLVMYSNNNVLYGNNITNNEDGIWLEYSSNNSIYGNRIANNIYGVFLNASSNNSLSGNNITNSLDSDLAIHIWLINSSNNNIYDNNIEKGYNGIYLSNSSYNNIYSNTITEITGVGGIILSKSSYNNIYANTLTNGNGISLITSSNNLIIQNNLNLTCDWLCWINLTGPPVCGGRVMLYRSSNNVIYHNNFVMNRRLLYINDSVNIWDDGYPSGGNYWSDYIATGNDTYSGPFQNETGSVFPKYTSDGIGDTEYIIDANNTDNYPLMGMFSDFKATSEYHVQTICSSTVVDFQYNGTAISFNVIGGNETVGFCRICVPTGLMNGTYTVIVNETWTTSPVIYILLPCSNSTHSYLYFGLNPSAQKVIIIPEFPTWTSMLLVLVVLTVAVFIHKQRLLKTSKH